MKSKDRTKEKLRRHVREQAQREKRIRDKIKGKPKRPVEIVFPWGESLIYR